MSATLETDVCIAGGGPAGMMLGLLLARAGVEVVVLEKHADFLRDFRGDTIHPSTLAVIDELGLFDAFLRLPHQKVTEISGTIAGKAAPVADFTSLSPRYGFIAMMPQWDFLAFLADAGQRYPNFRLLMRAEVTGLTGSDAQITGVEATTPEGPLTITATLVVGADGRTSTVRNAAHLQVSEFGAPMDVMWFHLPKGVDDPYATGGYLGTGHMLVLINRGEYWQSGYVIPKGMAEAVRTEGLPAFRARLAQLAPFTAQTSGQITTWDDVKLLTVRVDRLERWYRPGLLCIGDAAHAMSPVGGVGINLAIQDAVATANALAVPLREGRLTTADLARVEARRAWPARATQWVQLQVQNRLIANVLSGKGLGDGGPLPLPLRLLGRYPWLRRWPARMIGLGARPEHVSSPAAVAP